ncbi:MAG: formate dehydrogenase iron-sulfur subunit, partial [Sphingomonadales bacterium]|nr:formate dehydrogenase iron-sulfur subunit [Sphingomonadales bacterium]
MRIFVPGDAGAVAVGADAVAAAVGNDVIRNGSRGMFELEPLLEMETLKGRIGFARVTPDDVPEILRLRENHPGYLGLVEELPFLKRQTRLTFARCGITDPRSIEEYRAYGGFKGLERAKTLGPATTVEEVFASGLRGRGGAGFPAGIKWRTAAAVGPGVVRNGSRGMFELEPLLEIETSEGRIGYARLAPEDVPDVLRLGKDHPNCVGPVDDLPYLKRQTRLTFVRCGITDPQS